MQILEHYVVVENVTPANDRASNKLIIKLCLFLHDDDKLTKGWKKLVKK